MKRINFKSLYFGMASAEHETAYDPERFIRTFYDRWGIKSNLDSPSYFLIVGPKGVGKSAISEFTKYSLIRKYGSHAVFTTTLDLDEITPSISSISAISSKLVSDESSGVTDSAWRLFIALRFFDLMIQDQGCSLNRDAQVIRIGDDLRRSGLSDSDFPTVLRRVRENKISLSLKGVATGVFSRKETDDVAVAQLGRALIKLILNADTQSHFLLSIDGLDRIIGNNPAYWSTLAALLRVSDQLHKSVMSSSIDLRLLVMCRSDVFRTIKFADADKIAGDSALFVDWGAHQTIPSDSHLWDYVCAKAQIETAELFSLLPEKVTVGQRGPGKSRNIKIAEYLLQFTRSTPREMTLLMKRLQEEVPENGYITPERVRSAVDNFASRDLLTIINSEATGVIEKEIHGRFGDIISSLRAATNITIDDIKSAVKAAGLDVSDVIDVVEFMFLAGLLGNYDPATGYVQFYHRRDTYKVKRSGPWTLHRGLMYAFNVPYSRSVG